jgi:hypothetical protein
MGDYSAFSRGHNRACPHSSIGGSIVLEWRPRVIGLVLLLILIGVVTGVLVPDDTGPLNWEW